METKQDIRKRIMCVRENLTEKERETGSEKITEQVVSHPLFVQAEEIWCYVSFGTEVDTKQILSAAWNTGKRIAEIGRASCRERVFPLV